MLLEKRWRESMMLPLPILQMTFEQKAFQETDLAKRIQQLILPEITQSLNIIGQKFSQLAPGIFEKIEVRLETEGIIKVSEHNWCLQD